MYWHLAIKLHCIASHWQSLRSYDKEDTNVGANSFRFYGEGYSELNTRFRLGAHWFFSRLFLAASDCTHSIQTTLFIFRHAYFRCFRYANQIFWSEICLLDRPISVELNVLLSLWFWFWFQICFQDPFVPVSLQYLILKFRSFDVREEMLQMFSRLWIAGVRMCPKKTKVDSTRTFRGPVWW